MTLQRLVLSGRDYILDAPAADRAAADILEAVRLGGDFIQLPSLRDTRTKVLVTASTSVRFESLPAQVDGETDEAPWVYYDFDIGE